MESLTLTKIWTRLANHEVRYDNGTPSLKIEELPEVHVVRYENWTHLAIQEVLHDNWTHLVYMDELSEVLVGVPETFGDEIPA